jgi:predicted ATPase with chaperone activity
MNKVLQPPTSAADLGIPLSLVHDLIFRLLFNEGEVSLVRMTEVLGLHQQALDEQLARMKTEHLVEITKAGQIGRLSYSYRLTDAGVARARDALERCQYIGPAPVDIDTYRRAIIMQAASRRVTPTEVKQALKYLILPENFHRRIGPAINAASSLFLYGPPGNGKTTIAQATGKLLAGTEPIWLPYALTVGGQIIKVHDPLVHIPWDEDTSFMEMGYPAGANGGAKGATGSPRYDRRWGRFQRPCVMVGGELTMDSLDLRFEPIAKFYEAPLQLKANGGMFLIDDFGRQQISPQQLLNRWIVPLESGIDFLRLQSGQTVEIPFRQLIVFSTNLDPSDLVDGAFLRRIQMKVEVEGPDEELFYQIFTAVCKVYNIAFDRDSFLHLLHKWYRETSRTMQAVHPRDIVRTVISICDYEGIPAQFTPDLIDDACRSYFVQPQNY